MRALPIAETRACTASVAENFGRWRTASIWAAVSPTAPARAIDIAVRTEYGEKKRLASFPPTAL